MSASNPNDFWLCYSRHGSSGTSMGYTTDDGGLTWSSHLLQVADDGTLDFHTSMFGTNNGLYFTWPRSLNIVFRKFNYPAHDNSDRDPMRTVLYGGADYRSNVMVQDNGRIWVFTRLSFDASQNVLYHYSDDEGASWTDGVAFATNSTQVRIGSMPYIDGNPALIVFYMYDQPGLRILPLERYVVRG